jgi:hypothetical protein
MDWWTHNSQTRIILTSGIQHLPPKKVPYSGVVVGLAWSNDPDSYTGGIVTTGKVSHARQVKGDPDDKGYSGPPGWGLDVKVLQPHLIKNIFW